MSERSIAEQLAAPFDKGEIKFKAQVVRGNRALAVAYVDARVVEDRLDDVFGPGGWQDSYQVLPSNAVICTLRVWMGTEWIAKSDVGCQSDQPDEGDRLKSAFSDALKRAAVKLGIGRFLYRLPQSWCEYDPQTRTLKSTPNLPDWVEARPDSKPASKPAAQPPAKVANGKAPDLKESAVKILEAAAKDGSASLKLANKTLTDAMKRAIKADPDLIEHFRKTAEQADARKREPVPREPGVEPEGE